MSVPARPVPLFADIEDVGQRLAETGYLPDTATATAVFLADRLGAHLAPLTGRLRGILAGADPGQYVVCA